MKNRPPNAGLRIRASDLRALDHEAYRGRSDVYRYLRRNYAKLIARRLGTADGPSWNALAAFLGASGFVSIRGEALSGNAVRRVFRRVERDIGCRQKASSKTQARPAPPSRQRADWQPPSPLPRQSAVPGTDPMPISKTDAAARIAELRRTFAERSGH
jgi:hypothetical protein